jgi:hypothetical protein
MIQELQDHHDSGHMDQFLRETEPSPQPQTERRADKTLRTKPLAMKVTPAFHKKLKIYAVEYEIDMVDIIEEAVALWISQLDASNTRKQ